MNKNRVQFSLEVSQILTSAQYNIKYIAQYSIKRRIMINECKLYLSLPTLNKLLEKKG